MANPKALRSLGYSLGMFELFLLDFGSLRHALRGGMEGITTIKHF